jgi:hypothetical protein
VIVIGLAAPVAVIPSGAEVTVYETIGLPPSLGGGVKLTSAPWFRGDGTGAAGWLGTVAGLGVTAFDAVDGWLVPLALVAITVTV